MGDFWVAVNVINSSTIFILPTGRRINQFGTVLETVRVDKEYSNTRISEVHEHHGEYYIGSRNVTVNFVGVYNAI